MERLILRMPIAIKSGGSDLLLLGMDYEDEIVYGVVRKEMKWDGEKRNP